MTFEQYPPLAIGLIIAALLGFYIVAGAQGDVEAFHEDSEEWCEERNGELYNAKSVAHGGLHCQLENGTTVHMSEVVEVNSP